MMRVSFGEVRLFNPFWVLFGFCIFVAIDPDYIVETNPCRLSTGGIMPSHQNLLCNFWSAAVFPVVTTHHFSINN